jgi:hypothetical protein
LLIYASKSNLGASVQKFNCQDVRLGNLGVYTGSTFYYDALRLTRLFEEGRFTLDGHLEELV